MREKNGKQAVKAIWQAYRNGKKAAWLPGEDFERILAEPIEVARARLNIPTPDRYLAIPESVRNAAANMG